MNIKQAKEVLKQIDIEDLSDSCSQSEEEIEAIQLVLKLVEDQESKIEDLENELEDMEEIKIGDFVRTKWGISKVIDSDVLKHSKNLIDILEEGDFVNGHLVVGKDENTFDQKTIVTEVDDKNGGIRHFYAEKRIDTVLTHEQYEQNCFRVKEEK